MTLHSDALKEAARLRDLIEEYNRQYYSADGSGISDREGLSTSVHKHANIFHE